MKIQPNGVVNGKRMNDGHVFIRKNRGELRLTTKPEPYSYERTLNWLRHQVAPSLKIASILDVLNEIKILSEMIREAV